MFEPAESSGNSKGSARLSRKASPRGSTPASTPWWQWSVPVKRLFIFTMILGLTAQAHAQTGNPAGVPGSIGPSGGPPTTGATSSAAATDPALSLRGMPCSVSLNSTGGVTTSSSCGTDPLSVPTQTLSSPASASSLPPSQSAQTGGGSTSSAQQSKTTASAGGGAGGGGTPSSSTTLCPGIPTTAGSTSVGSLTGAGC